MKKRPFGDNWNFWTVKYLRQMRHNFSLVICVGVLLLVQLLIFRSYLGDVPLPKEWPPWWLFLLLIGCGLGTGVCVALCFGASSGKNHGGGFEHFTGYSPLDTNKLIRGYLYSFLLTFGILFGSCAFAWGGAVFLFPGKTFALLLWSLDACLLTFILLQLDGMRTSRADQLVLIVLVLSLVCRKLFDHSFKSLSDFSLTIFLMLSAVYLGLLLRESFLPRGAVREVTLRLGSIAFPVAGYLIDVPFLALVPAAEAFVAMGSAVDGVPRRQLKRLSGGVCRRFAAWLFYGSSAGGWLWCWGMAAATWGILMFHREQATFALILVSWGLASTEACFLIAGRRRTRRGSRTEEFNLSILGGCFLILIVLFVMNSAVCGLVGDAMFLVGANWGWAAAAVLLIPNLPRMVEDYRKIVLGRNGK